MMALAASAALLSLAGALGSAEDVLLARTRAFLDAYAANRVEQVVDMLDPERIAVYGSDTAEFCQDAACVRALMADDFRLWGSARFGAMSKVTVRMDGRLASVMFEIPFSAGGGAEVPVRIAMVWRTAGGKWRLTQSSNVVPTVGASASALLGGAPR